jgi:hypothetical protein
MLTSLDVGNAHALILLIKITSESVSVRSKAPHILPLGWTEQPFSSASSKFEVESLAQQRPICESETGF